MDVLASKTDIGLYDPKINAYKFAIAFHDANMIEPISGVFELKFYSVWGESVVSLKCGRIMIDFGLESHVKPHLSEGQLLSEITFINPKKHVRPNNLIHFGYLVVLLIALCPFLYKAFVRFSRCSKRVENKSILIILVFGGLALAGTLLVAHFFDVVFEAIPALLVIFFLQRYLYNKM